jgi:serine/threonine protein kinase
MATLQSGDVLGPYTIEKILGHGGMGEVYQAVDHRLGRGVAIKILPEHLAARSESLKRFEREARTLASLSHPNILIIHDVGTQGATSYVVTELLQGKTLREVLVAEALPWKRSTEIGIAIAEGLAAAHSKGVIHRDIKPENIFITSDGRIKILDFGLARQTATMTDASTDLTASTSQTGTGGVVGTLPYMSPEQLRGESIDPRTDLFSFGCVLLEMIGGQSPFRRETAAETVAAILKEEPLDLTGRSENVPSDLLTLARACVAKNRKVRLQSAHDLAIRLKSLLSDPLITSKKVRTKAAKPSRRTNLPIASLAVLPFINVGEDPEMDYLSDGITESLMNSLAQLPNLRVISRSSVFRYKGNAEDPLNVGRELRVQGIVTGRVQQRGKNLVISSELVDVRNDSHLWGEQYNKPLSDIFAIQEEISREISQKLQMKLTGKQKQLLVKRYTENTEAYHLYLKGRYYWNQRTPEGARKGIQYFLEAVQKDPGYALAYAGLSDSHRALEEMQEARLYAMKSLAIDEDLAEAHQCLARIRFNHDWDWKGAEAEFKRAIELNSNYAEAHHSYSHYLIAMNRIQESLTESVRCLELDPVDVSLNTHLGWHYLFSRQYEEGIDQTQKTLELYPSYYPAHVYLGACFKFKKMYAEAIPEFEKAMQLSENTEARAWLTQCYAALGRKDEARNILNEWGNLGKTKHFTPLETAGVLISLDEFDAAIEYLQIALKQRSAEIVYLNVDPLWDPLRSDPRFSELLQKMQLN